MVPPVPTHGWVFDVHAASLERIEDGYVADEGDGQREFGLPLSPLSGAEPREKGAQLARGR